MAITYVSHQVSAGPSYTNFEAAMPSGLQDGDVVVAFVHMAGTSDSGADAAWTPIFDHTPNGSTAYAAYYRIIPNATTEPASYIFTRVSSDDIIVLMAAFRGVDTSNPLDVTPVVHSQTGNSVNVIVPSITTETDGAQVVWMCGVGSGSATLTPEQTTLLELSTDAYRCAIGTYNQATAGATGNKDGSVDPARLSNGMQVALRPGEGSGPGEFNRMVPASANIFVAGGGPTTETFYASDDTITQDTQPDTNFGSSPLLEVRETGPVSTIFMRFALPNRAAIHEATLRLYIDNGTSTGPSLRLIDDPWDEDTLTYNNQPTYGADLMTLPMSTPGQWEEYDVTSHVPLEGDFSFALVGQSTNGADVSSKEGSFPPELILDYNPAPPSIQQHVPASGVIYAEPNLMAIMSVAESRNDGGPITPTLDGASVVSGNWRLTSGDSISARVAPIPDVENFDEERTIYVVGDIHVGNSLSSRRDIVTDDIQTNMAGRWAQIVQTGDLTHNATSGEVTEGKAFMDSLGEDWKIIGGNHDYYSGVTQSQYESTYNTTRNWYQDIGTDIRLIGLSNTGGSATTVVLDSTALSFLGTNLGNTDRDCIIFCHAPLYQSVLIDPIWPDSNGSEESNRHATPVSTINTILSENPNARGWFSGHTHSALTSPQLMMSYPLPGDETICAVNVSSIAYPGKGSDDLARPLSTCFVTVYPDRLEVRHRNHKTEGWHEIDGETIYVYEYDRFLP